MSRLEEACGEETFLSDSLFLVSMPYYKKINFSSVPHFSNFVSERSPGVFEGASVILGSPVFLFCLRAVARDFREGVSKSRKMRAPVVFERASVVFREGASGFQQGSSGFSRGR